ncbi:phosphatidate cytidylyltransferase [Agromyces sp. NPDC058064]|uniref:phosphatidate cytidylyltransferase n=1 Tax=Agromyces sp. NPDC058064 TaxID=3346322 RepID=UPI0036D8EEC8
MSWFGLSAPATVGLVLLVATALPVLAFGNPTIRSRWLTWAVIGVIVGVAEAIGVAGAVVVAIAVSVVCIVEYVRLAGLSTADRWVLIAAGVSAPVLAAVNPAAVGAWLPFALLAAAVLPVLSQDPEAALPRATAAAFGMLWLVWAPAQLVIIHEELTLLILTVAVTDVASWAVGKSLGRLPGARLRPFAVSPNKTIAGLLGGALAAAGVLAVTREFSWVLLLAAAIGAPLGDIIASMVKRHAGVKDAGAWLPGFGGLLDRADSLLVVAPLFAAAAAAN